MTSITWKDGGPLMTAGGLIGGSPACCCENPPPPVCVCPDMCSYFMAVLSPEEVAVKSPPIICGSALVVEKRERVNGHPFPGDLGFGFEPYEELDVVAMQDRIDSVAANLSGFGSLAGVVYKRGQWRREFEVDGVGLVEEYAILEMAISAIVRCSAADSAYMADVIVSAAFRVSGFSDAKGGRDSPIKTYYSSKQITVPLPSFCLYSGRDHKTCLDQTIVPQDGLRLLESPVEISVSEATATILGDEHELVGFGGWSGDGEISPLVESAIADFSAEFRITSRRTCVSAPCSCSAAYGTEWTFSDGTRSKTFTHGIDDVEWGGSPYYFSWDGVGYMVLEIFDPEDYVTGLGGLVIERHTVQISCETIDDVSTWMASVFSQCIQYNNVPQITHETYDEWAGVFECVPGCEDEHRAAGDPVLDGDLVDVEYLGRSTAVGTTECTPPPRIAISVKQIATC